MALLFTNSNAIKTMAEYNPNKVLAFVLQKMNIGKFIKEHGTN